MIKPIYFNDSLETVSFLLKIVNLYVPNPQKLLDILERVSTGQTQLSQTERERRPHVLTVNQSKPCPAKAVLPAEQTAAQAKSQLEREGINPKEVEKAAQSLTQRGAINTSFGTVNSNGKKRETTNKSGTKGTKKRKEFNDIFKIE